MNEPLHPLPFTGERFTPECEREIRYEHLHRYVFARQFARGKRVLDAACGEGYGSWLMADVASEVVGVDIDKPSIDHARARYQAPNLRFEQADCTKLDVPPRSFDLVVSFETLEHVDAQDALLSGFAHAVADDGMLIVSSPDRHAYSDARDFHNEFHVRELYRNELLDLLGKHFAHVLLLGQKLLFQSVVWTLERTPESASAHTLGAPGERPVDGLDYAPLYFMAICSRSPLSVDVPELSVFGDREESVYEHYNGEVRKNMNAGARIQELEAEVGELKATLAQAASQATTAPRPATLRQRLLQWVRRERAKD